MYWFSNQRPAIFRQRRIGYHGKHFIINKFRTLSTNEALPLIHRKFNWGSFLRRTNLDELPQLWNVLKGDISFVGPRPLPVEYESLLSEQQRARHSVFPGITGYAQVSGKNNLPWEGKFELDLKYVREMSFWVDIRIMLKTVALIAHMKKDVSLEEKPLGQ